MSEQRPPATGPAVHVSSITPERKTMYPSPYAERVADRERRRLGDRFGLTQFGVNLTTVGPGSESALRHWHTGEDELVYILSGELVLVTNAGEQPVAAGMVVAFPAGKDDGHHFINRSDAPAQYLEVGSRVEDDDAHYPDDDLKWARRDGKRVPAHKDGTLY